MESEEFQLLPVNQLVAIISSDELNVRSEEQVFNAVMAWVRYNIQERRLHLSTVRGFSTAIAHAHILVTLVNVTRLNMIKVRGNIQNFQIYLSQ